MNTVACLEMTIISTIIGEFSLGRQIKSENEDIYSREMGKYHGWNMSQNM